MQAEGSVTMWMRGCREGDEEAAERLFKRYFRRMVAVARQRLGGDWPAFDSEDVALSAFHSFCSALNEPRYQTLNREAGLWRLLVVMTERKAGDKLKGERAVRRGGAGRHPVDGVIRGVDQRLSLEDIATEGDDPELLMLMAEQYQRLLQRLNDAELERVAIAKMEGYTNQEIGERLGYSRRTVQRMLNLIKQLWMREAEECFGGVQVGDGTAAHDHQADAS